MTHAQHSLTQKFLHRRRRCSAHIVTQFRYPYLWLRRRPRLLVVGFGDVAHRLAHYLGSRVQIIAVSRQRPGLSSVLWKGIDLDSSAVTYLPKKGYLGMMYFAPPPSHGNTDPRVRRVLNRLQIEHAVYLSTTGVYGNQASRWIDETQPLAAQTDRAKRRVAAEKVFRKWGTCIKKSGSRRRAMILRTPGIYAHNRLPIERLKAQLPALIEEDDVYTNHIHADDLARLAWWTLFFGRTQRVYNACDNTSLKMGDYFDSVAKALNLPAPPRVSREALKDAVSPVQRSFMEESRRIRNDRVVHELQFVYRYPELSTWLSEAASSFYRANT